MDELTRQFKKFQAQFEQAQQRFANLHTAQEGMADIEASATSPDKAVRVVAGTGGAIKDIRISAEAMENGDAATLSAAITSTLQQAVAAAAQKQAAAVDEAAGGAMGFSVSDQVFEAQAEAFDTTVDELKEKAAGAQADDADEHEDDDEEPAERSPAPSSTTPAPARRKAQEVFDEDDEDEAFGSVYE